MGITKVLLTQVGPKASIEPHGPGLEAAKKAGPSLGLNIQPVAAPSAADFDNAFSAMSKERAQAVLVLSTPLFIAGAAAATAPATPYNAPSKSQMAIRSKSLQSLQQHCGAHEGSTDHEWPSLPREPEH